MTGLFILLATGFGLLWAVGVVLSAWLLTHPPRRTYSAAVSRGRPGDPSELPSARAFETWFLESRGLKFPVWDIKGDASNGPMIVMTHGWADSKIGALIRLDALTPVASRILAWDLPGHGESPGICRLGTREVDDLLALVDRLGRGPIVLMGWSLGAGVSLAAAALRPDLEFMCIIAEAPYRLAPTPAANVLRARGLPAMLIVQPVFGIMRLVLGPRISNARFDRARAASIVQCPVLVVHGDADSVCPVGDGRAIAAASGGDMLEVAQAGHNDLWTAEGVSARVVERVRTFISRAGKSETA